MKLFITAIITLVTAVAVAQAPKKKAAATKSFARNYGIAGCGLGSMAMGKQGAQVFAATTNGTSWNQMFGISSGTLNCLDSASNEVASRMDQFIMVNKDQLQADIAKGNGETIAVISDVMGCKADNKVLGQALKNNYSTIFQTGLPANEITDRVITTIQVDENLSAQCKTLS